MKLKVRDKLLGAALCVSVMSLALCVIGAYNTRRVAQNSRTMYEKVAAPLLNLYLLDEAYEETRTNIRDQIFRTDETAIRQKIDEADGHFKVVEDNAALFEKSITSDTIRKSFAAFRESFANYKSQTLRARGLDLAKKDAEAVALLKGGVNDAEDKLEAALADLLQGKVAEAKLSADSNDSISRGADMMMAILGIGSFVLAWVFGLGFAISLSRPILAAEDLARRIVGGDLTRGLDGDFGKRSDEIGSLASSLDRMRHDLALSVGDIRNSVGEILEVGQTLATGMESATSAVSQIKATVESVENRVISQSASVSETSATIDQIIKNIEFLNGQIEDQSKGVSQSSASVEEMVANVQFVTKNVERLGEAFAKLVEASGDGQNKLNAVNVQIREIAEQSEKLLEANAVITNIAGQTNLLAMNAAIEAAHAGEYGKGFAVVADEIRNLAEMSASHSKSISTDIRAIKSTIDSVVSSSDAAERSFSTILGQIESAGTLEREIKQAMLEQGAGSRQVLDALATMNEITQRVRDGSAEMNEGSKAIGQEMGMLLQASLQLKTDMAEISNGTGEIKHASETVSAMSVRNARLINEVSEKVARYIVG
jgi:methyl-accepting chemotaxis protein